MFNTSASTAQATTLQGTSVNVVADQNLVSVGSQFKGTESLHVEGKDTSAFYAATNTQQSNASTQSSSSLLGINLSKSEVTDSKAQSLAVATSLISDKKVQIGVGNNTELQGTTVQAPQIAFVQTDPTKAGNLILSGSTDTTQTSHTEKSDSALGLWQAASGKGSTTQTLNQTSLKGNVSFDNALKITAQLPQGDLKTQVQTLGAQGGLGYLSTLANKPGVKWDKVALAHDQWNYSQEGLSGAGAAVLTLVVAYFTAGAGTAVVGEMGATATTTAAAAAATAGSTAMGAAGLAALNTGISALAAQASVAMVNNGGDIGKTLAQLGSEQSVKNLLTTMVTAGALSGLDQALGFNSTQTATGQSGPTAVGSTAANGVATSQATNAFQQNLLQNVTNNVAGAAINSAINGKAFDENSLSSALSSALITAGMASGANAIGDAATGKNGNPAQIDVFTQKLAHAVLGCAGGAALSGGCGAGALGAIVGEMAADYVLNSGGTNAQASALAKTLGAVAGVLVGGGGANAAAVNIAATTATNAAENNRQLHPTEIQWIKSNAKKFANQLSQNLGRPVSDAEAARWLTSAGESDVDVGMQRSNGQFVRGTSNTEDAQSYDAAKSFINSNTKTNSSFVDASGKPQTLFTAKNGDFYKPEVYSQYRNDPQYRDYYWDVMGINLKGDSLTPQERSVYDQRQAIANKQTVMELAALGVTATAGRLAIRQSSMAASIAQERAKKESVFERIIEIPKGQKPGPSTYLSENYLDTHLADFKESGVVRFTSESSLKSYGTAGPDGGFVFPRNKFDGLIIQANGNLSIVEQRLGLPAGYLTTGEAVAVYIKPADVKGLRIPSGNEGGALPSEWIPGGYTRGGMPEAVMDFSYKPPITILRFNEVKK